MIDKLGKQKAFLLSLWCYLFI